MDLEKEQEEDRQVADKYFAFGEKAASGIKKKQRGFSFADTQKLSHQHKNGGSGVKTPNQQHVFTSGQKSE